MYAIAATWWRARGQIDLETLHRRGAPGAPAAGKLLAGLLRDDEVAAIAERANEARTPDRHPAEHVSGDGRYRADVLAVELHEAVTAGACPNSAKKTGIRFSGWGAPK